MTRHTDTGYHAHINVDSLEHRDGAWSCSPDGQNEPRSHSFLNVPMFFVALVLVVIAAAVGVALAVFFPFTWKTR